MQVLVINSSAGGRESVSRALVEDVVEALRVARLEAAFCYRDLALDLVPHLTADTLKGVRGTPATESEWETRARSDTLIAELKAADVIVIGVPMYNFGIPSALKAWIDHIVRADETFRRTDDGPEGLLVDKQVIVVESSGGVYSEGPRRPTDCQEPYLRVVLNYIGLTNLHFVRAEGTLGDPEKRDASIVEARTKLRRVVDGIA